MALIVVENSKEHSQGQFTKLENCLELGGPVPQHNIRLALKKKTRYGYKVIMAAMEEGKIDFVVRIKREQGKS